MSNAAAIGYMILAAKRVGIKPHLIRELERKMFEMMDERSEQEAQQAFRKIE